MTVQNIIASVEVIHSPMRGEARQDPRRYCRICRDSDGGAKVWPCQTLRLIRELAAAPAEEP